MILTQADCHPTALHPQLGFYAGGIYFIRNNASSYDIGEIGGRRQSPTAVSPALAAVQTPGKLSLHNPSIYTCFGPIYDVSISPEQVRSYAISPFAATSQEDGHDKAIYFAGYDCSGVPSPNTACK